MPPLAAGAGAAGALVAYLWLARPWELAAYIVLMLAVLALFGDRHGTVVRVLQWTAPIIIPVTLIHSFLNGAFPTEARIWGLIPWRPTGFTYGLHVSLNVLLLATAATQLLLVQRDDLTSGALRLRLPPLMILLVTQSIAMIGIVSRRISNVYIAQQARGIPVGPGVVARITAFPSVLIPTVVATLIETESRVPALVSQGFGSAPPLSRPPRRMYGSGWWFAGLPFFVLGIVRIAGGLVR